MKRCWCWLPPVINKSLACKALYLCPYHLLFFVLFLFCYRFVGLLYFQRICFSSRCVYFCISSAHGCAILFCVYPTTKTFRANIFHSGYSPPPPFLFSLWFHPNKTDTVCPSFTAWYHKHYATILKLSIFFTFSLSFCRSVSITPNQHYYTITTSRHSRHFTKWHIKIQNDSPMSIKCVCEWCAHLGACAISYVFACRMTVVACCVNQI